MGVADDCHERPASVVRRTRATAAAPVASQALLSPWVAAQVPLAANAPSPGCAAGGFLSSGQPSLPPLLVCRKGHWASYESSIRKARQWVQNANQTHMSRGDVDWAFYIQD